MDSVVQIANAIAEEASIRLTFSEAQSPPSLHHLGCRWCARFSIEGCVDCFIRRLLAVNGAITPFGSHQAWASCIADSLLLCSPTACQERGFIESVSFSIRAFPDANGASLLFSFIPAVYSCLPLRHPLSAGADVLSLLTGERVTIRSVVNASFVPLTQRQRMNKQHDYEHYLPQSASDFQSFLCDYVRVG